MGIYCFLDLESYGTQSLLITLLMTIATYLYHLRQNKLEQAIVLYTLLNKIPLHLLLIHRTLL